LGFTYYFDYLSTFQCIGDGERVKKFWCMGYTWAISNQFLKLVVNPRQFYLWITCGYFLNFLIKSTTYIASFFDSNTLIII